MKKKKGESTFKEILHNNIYSVKLAFGLSKSRVIHTASQQAISYFMWVFYSAFFVRYIINAIQEQRDVKEILQAIIIIGIASLVLQGYSKFCDTAIFPVKDVLIHKKLYSMIYRKSENVELNCYEDSSFYNKYTMALDDSGTKLNETIRNLFIALFGTIAGLSSFYVMIQIDKLTILFMIAPLLGNFYFAPKLNTLVYSRYKDSVPYVRKTEYVNRVMYLADYAKELRLSNIFNVLERDYNKSINSISSLWRKYFNKAFILGMFQYIFSYVIIFEGILLYGAYRALVDKSNPITLAQMAVLTSVMVTASWVWLGVIDAINTCAKNALYMMNLRTFLEYKEKIPEDSDGIMPSDQIESIEFKNVSFTYDGKNNVINKMSFTINKNTAVALVGHNGAGKTTIIKLLMRLYDPSEGTILVNGHDIREYNLRAYRRLFATAFQDYRIFAGTVRYNILMGRTIDNEDDSIYEALKLAGIYDRIMKLPQRLETILTKEFDDAGAVLSGGECQKLIVARAFINSSQIAIFDEPSSALDPISENELFNNIVQKAKGRITIYISHRLSCVKDADYVYMLENGEIIEQGKHQELLEGEGSYAQMYHMQEKNYYALD
jgi:ATP-binding cassette subfamily B protein